MAIRLSGTQGKTYVIARAAMPGEVLNGNNWQQGGVTYFEIAQKSLSANNSISFQTKDPSFADPITFANDTVTFTPRGTAAGGSAYLMPNKEFAQNKQEKMKRITVLATTGRVRLSSYVGGAWK